MHGGGWKVHDGSPVTAVDLGEFVVGAGQADLESFDFAEPSFAFGLGDPGAEVVADLRDSLPLSRIWPVHRAAQAPLTELPEGPSEFFPGVNGL